MSDDKPKVVSLQLRRQLQLKQEGRVPQDAVIRLADEITTLLGEQQMREVKEADPQKAFDFACDQLIAAELSVNTLLRVLEHSLGVVTLNSVLVEVDRRKHHYSIEDGSRKPWPEHDQSKTYMDRLEEREEPKEEAGPGRVVPFKKEPEGA